MIQGKSVAIDHGRRAAFEHGPRGAFGSDESATTGANRDEAIDFFARVLPGIVESAAPFRSETTLAIALDTTTRRLQELRGAGLVTPRRLGRGYVYGPDEVRRSSVLVALMRLGATLGDLAGLMRRDGRRCASCSARRDGPDCAVARCCEALLEDLRERTEAEITRLRSLDGLLQQYAVDARADLAPRRVAV